MEVYELVEIKPRLGIPAELDVLAIEPLGYLVQTLQGKGK